MSLFTVTFGFLLTYCLAQADDAVVPFFRKDFTYLKDLKAFYKYENVGRKWSESLAVCKAQGAEMLVPKSKLEVDTILETFDFTDSLITWIGAHDMFSEGDYITIDGRPFSESFLNWRPGEPNNINNNEHCAIMDTKGEYVDIPCGHEHKVLCKKSAVNLTQNPVCETYDLAYTYTTQTDSCYKFHTLPMNWHQAYRTCRGEQAQLTIINSESESRVLQTMFAKHPERTLKGSFAKNIIHLGFNDLYNSGIYLTLEGQTLKEAGYDNWNQGEPSSDNEHCGSMYRDGTLNDFDCNGSAMFVCEKKLSTTVAAVRPIASLPDESK